MVDKNLPHIFLQNAAETVFFTSLASMGRAPRIPNRNSQQHGANISAKLNQAWQESEEKEQSRSAVSLPTKSGIYLEFKSQAGHDLIIKSLENLTQNIRLLNVRTEGEENNKTTIATVYVPTGKESYFLDKINAYTEKGEKNKNLVESIEDVRLAVLESFWQDDITLVPRENQKWCEVWLRITDGEEIETENKFRSLCEASNIECREGQIRFPERSVLLVKGNDEALAELIARSADIAEFRLAKETAEFWVELPNEEQSQWVEDLLNRTTVNDNNVSVCVLDAGTNNGHSLLSIVLQDSDCHSYDPDWGTHDHHPQGHGTSMCGVVAYGDIQDVLLNNSKIEINHSLESVKILPPSGAQNPQELWGHITSQALSRAEIQNPDRLRINCMAVTSEDSRDRGRPSSWSATLDSLSAGYNEGNESKRLFMVSSGNVHDSNEWKNYPSSNETYSIHDPGQAWNALTVGAVTYKTDIKNPDYADYTPIAPYGGLSPFSTTSLVWERKWPLKPEIVLEGGNAGKDTSNFTTEIDDLSVLTTHHDFNTRQFSVINATSAATAEASRLAATIQAAYPQAWPETIRALMVHSARWTDELKQQFNITDTSNKTTYSNLLRTCGYGVPDLNRALYCASNTLTLVAQETIQPYDKKESGSGYCTKDMHVHDLPWPKDVLLGLGNTPIQLKVTLSYFVEPGPGEIGWKDRYRYPSHGFRFDLNSPNETKERFTSRLNAAARSDGADTNFDSGSDRWLIGSNTRHLGSIHSDIWEGPAAEMATCNMIGIYPIIGWWRERGYLNRWDSKTRYSLIVSLHTPEEEIDIYTPISIALQTPVTIESS